jgi:hypothetical protein
MHRNNTKKTPCVAISISNQQKPHVSLFIFYEFSSTQSENRGVEQVWGGGGQLVPVGGGSSKERGRKMNTVQIMHTDVCKCRNDTC